MARLGTLVTALNALGIDPGELWKGSWRWYAETMLGCCVDLDEIKRDGIPWAPWCCLARCQGLDVDAVRAQDSSIVAFREAVAAVCANDDRVLCVSYSRQPLGQAGDGHYSPIGAYLAASDMVLIMDVARFKHPPHWVPLACLWEAMGRPDKVTGRSRGYAVLSRPFRPPAGGSIRLTVGRGRLLAVQRHFGSDHAGADSNDRSGSGDAEPAALSAPFRGV